MKKLVSAIAASALVLASAFPAFAAGKKAFTPPAPIKYTIIISVGGKIGQVHVEGSKRASASLPDGGTVTVAGSGPLQWAGEKAAQASKMVGGKDTGTTRHHIKVTYVGNGKKLTGVARLCSDAVGAPLFVSFDNQSQETLCTAKAE